VPSFDVGVSFPLAFLAGLVSFLSPCVLPVVPGYLTFVSGMTLDELRDGDVGRARARAVLHAALFGIGFGIVFMTLGAAATAAGQGLARWLPAITRFGGVLVIAFGLHSMGLLRIPGLARERRAHLASRPEGWIGSILVGIAFGAGWTPCIGPVLASILLYAGLETTMLEGMALLGTYGLGLAVPFIGSAVALNWVLAGTRRLGPWLPWIERVAGAMLVALGVLMVGGWFAELTAYLADLGQVFTLELE
jgi:cytochrome c-type biogenesis protein